MPKLSIPYGAYVLVCDGRKALFLRNQGDEKFPNLRAERVELDEDPHSRDRGSNRAGRAFARADTHRRSAMDQTDWHELEEHRFASGVASTLDRLVRSEGVAVAIVAPPKILSELRRTIQPDTRKRIIAEIDKDLTKHPIAEIERQLTGTEIDELRG
jgi:protein required for attachment to host cells